MSRRVVVTVYGEIDLIEHFTFSPREQPVGFHCEHTGAGFHIRCTTDLFFII